MQASRQTRRSNNALLQSLRGLASGRRINQAADDAAGLAIAERFNSQIRQGRQEINNLQSGVNLLSTADGALTVQQQATQRLRELSIQASNGTLSDANREAINAEAQQLIQQIDSIAQDTQFNGQNLLEENTTLDLGTEGGNQVNINASTAQDLGVDTIDLSTAAGASAAIGAADAALEQLSLNQANIGAQANRFESAITQRETNVLNAAESEAAIRDLDVARAVIERTRNEILLQSGIAAIAQSNVSSQLAVRLLGG